MMQWNEQAGYAVLPEFIPVLELPALIGAAERVFTLCGRRPAGVRRVLGQSALFAEFARSQRIKSLIWPILGDGAFVVRSILFDKSPEANWDVAWHQDTTIAVSGRKELAGFGPWSMKEGVPHVRPPAEILERMVTLRIHLDANDANNGPLLVAPGTHRDGIHTQPPDTTKLEAAKVTCLTPAGGAVLLRPLLFHASRKAARAHHRRILHLEFAAEPLPAPLQWSRE